MKAKPPSHTLPWGVWLQGQQHDLTWAHSLCPLVTGRKSQQLQRSSAFGPLSWECKGVAENPGPVFKANRKVAERDPGQQPRAEGSGCRQLWR